MLEEYDDKRQIESNLSKATENPDFTFTAWKTLNIVNYISLANCQCAD
jgi:hypothetical protein